MNGGTVPDIARYAERKVVGTEHPTTLAEIRRILARANREGLRLYPVSGGRNWGAGSRQPVSDECTIVDLGLMNAIRVLNPQSGYAVIEAGVTQRQLAQSLAGSDWLANVTASCADSSIVGNALERGEGLLRSRVDDVLGLEVALPGGDIITTGGLSLRGDYAGRPAGPDLTQLFVQSNFGIVTAAAISLVRRPSVTRIFHARMPGTAFLDALNVAIRFTREAPGHMGLIRLFNLVLTPTVHSPASTSWAPSSSFELFTPILGWADNTALVAEHLAAALTALGRAESMRCVDIQEVTDQDPLHPLARMLRGDPNCDIIKAQFGRACADLDTNPAGWMLFLPLVPLDAGGPSTAMTLLQDVVNHHQVQVTVAVTPVSAHAANLVMQIKFPTDHNSIQQAHRMRRAARTAFRTAGFYPYRSNIDDMPLETAARDDAQGAILHAIKTLLDPSTNIAPGRYIN